MTAGGRTSTRRGVVAGRGRSLRRPEPPPPAPPLTVRPPSAGVLRRLIEWSGWTKIAALTTTIAAIAALWFTAQSLRATDNQYALSQQTAVTDRFQKAVEQLTSDKVDIRLSGIYLLERLSRDSPSDHPTVFAVLSAYLRTHTSATNCRVAEQTKPIPPVDIQAIATVIGRRDVTRDDEREPIDLRRTCLAGADLVGANLTGVVATRADLGSVDLRDATLSGTMLAEADLSNAFFGGARLDGTILTDANLTHAFFAHATYSGTFFSRANLTDATFGLGSGGADLSGANFIDANLTRARFVNANLTHATLYSADLFGANFEGAVLRDATLDEAQYNGDTKWPAGFVPLRPS